MSTKPATEKKQKQKQKKKPEPEPRPETPSGSEESSAEIERKRLRAEEEMEELRAKKEKKKAKKEKAFAAAAAAAKAAAAAAAAANADDSSDDSSGTSSSDDSSSSSSDGQPSKKYRSFVDDAAADADAESSNDEKRKKRQTQIMREEEEEKRLKALEESPEGLAELHDEKFIDSSLKLNKKQKAELERISREEAEKKKQALFSNAEKRAETNDYNTVGYESEESESGGAREADSKIAKIASGAKTTAAAAAAVVVAADAAAIAAKKKLAQNLRKKSPPIIQKQLQPLPALNDGSLEQKTPAKAKAIVAAAAAAVVVAAPKPVRPPVAVLPEPIVAIPIPAEKFDAEKISAMANSALKKEIQAVLPPPPAPEKQKMQFRSLVDVILPPETVAELRAHADTLVKTDGVASKSKDSTEPGENFVSLLKNFCDRYINSVAFLSSVAFDSKDMCETARRARHCSWLLSTSLEGVMKKKEAARGAGESADSRLIPERSDIDEAAELLPKTTQKKGSAALFSSLNRRGRRGNAKSTPVGCHGLGAGDLLPIELAKHFSWMHHGSRTFRHSRLIDRYTYSPASFLASHPFCFATFADKSAVSLEKWDIPEANSYTIVQLIAPTTPVALLREMREEMMHRRMFTGLDASSTLDDIVGGDCVDEALRCMPLVSMVYFDPKAVKLVSPDVLRTMYNKGGTFISKNEMAKKKKEAQGGGGDIDSPHTPSHLIVSMSIEDIQRMSAEEKAKIAAAAAAAKEKEEHAAAAKPELAPAPVKKHAHDDADDTQSQPQLKRQRTSRQLLFNMADDALMQKIQFGDDSNEHSVRIFKSLLTGGEKKWRELCDVGAEGLAPGVRRVVAILSATLLTFFEADQILGKENNSAAPHVSLENVPKNRSVKVHHGLLPLARVVFSQVYKPESKITADDFKTIDRACEVMLKSDGAAAKTTMAHNTPRDKQTDIQSACMKLCADDIDTTVVVLPYIMPRVL